MKHTNVNKPSILQEVYKFFHGSLMAWSTKDVLLGRPLFVQLQDEHQQRPRDVILAHLLQRDPKLHPVS